MVGGTVVEVLNAEPGLWVNCRERQSGRECAIFVESGGRAAQIRAGDQLWWQSSWAFWTPASGEAEDVRLNRIGFSGVRRPDPSELVH